MLLHSPFFVPRAHEFAPPSLSYISFVNEARFAERRREEFNKSSDFFC